MSSRHFWSPALRGNSMARIAAALCLSLMALFLMTSVHADDGATKSGTQVSGLLSIDEVVDGDVAWGFSLGQEFPGAKGSLTVVKDQPVKGTDSLKLAGDFTGGGQYVETTVDLRDLQVPDINSVRLKIKSD